MELLATTSAYRPTLIDGGRHHKPNRQSGRFGQPLVSQRWRLVFVYDGRVRWKSAGEQRELKPGDWGLQPPNADATSVSVSTGCHWGEVRFAATPDQSGDPNAQALWGVELPVVLPAAEVVGLQGAVEDMLSWWWRDSWYRVRADARLGGLLAELVHRWRGDDRGGLVHDDAFLAADEIWATRPLAALPELARACGLSERHFRREFAAVRGCSPSTWAKRVMAAQAKELLRRHDNWSVGQVGKHLGYRYPQTFIRAFTNETGFTPTGWRRGRN